MRSAVQKLFGILLLFTCQIPLAHSAELARLDAYIVMLAPNVEMTGATERLKTRNADPRQPSFSAQIDTRSVFSANKNMRGFRMIGTEEAVQQMRADPDVRLVEKDSVVSVDTY